jgi:hypothetical protein
MSSFIGNNPSEYEGKYIEENSLLKDYLRWCLDMLENRSEIDPSYYSEIIEKIRKSIN